MFKLADILKNLESTSPEDTFVKKLAGLEESAPVAEPTPVAQTSEEVNDLKKQAEEADGIGRVMARSFMDELQKIAVGVTSLTPNPDAVHENPAVVMPNVDIHEADVKKVQAIIQQLTAGERMKGPQGYVQVNGAPAETTQPVAVDETPIAYDVHKKAANAEIIENLYARYFAEGN